MLSEAHRIPWQLQVNDEQRRQLLVPGQRQRRRPRLRRLWQLQQRRHGGHIRQQGSVGVIQRRQLLTQPVHR